MLLKQLKSMQFGRVSWHDDQFGPTLERNDVDQCVQKGWISRTPELGTKLDPFFASELWAPTVGAHTLVQKMGPFFDPESDPHLRGTSGPTTITNLSSCFLCFVPASWFISEQIGSNVLITISVSRQLRAQGQKFAERHFQWVWSRKFVKVATPSNSEIRKCGVGPGLAGHAFFYKYACCWFEQKVKEETNEGQTMTYLTHDACCRKVRTARMQASAEGWRSKSWCGNCVRWTRRTSVFVESCCNEKK